jgi:hypothetical protein
VQTYRSVRAAIDINFRLTSLTSFHSDPHMDNTFRMLHNHFIVNKPHEFIKGRRTKYEVENLMDKGVDLMTADGMVYLGDDEGDDSELQAEPEDVVALL